MKGRGLGVGIVEWNFKFWDSVWGVCFIIYYLTLVLRYFVFYFKLP